LQADNRLDIIRERKLTEQYVHAKRDETKLDDGNKQMQ